MTTQTAPQTAEAAAEISWPAVRITATHITLLQLAPSAHAALVQYRDGSVDVVPDLRAEPAPSCARVLRHPGRAWADELVAAERNRLEESGVPVPVLGTLRKLAGIVATEELAAEARVAALSQLREAVADELLEQDDLDVDAEVLDVTDPRPAQRVRGRHVAQRSAATVELEEQARWAFTCEVLEAGDPVLV